MGDRIYYGSIEKRERDRGDVSNAQDRGLHPAIAAGMAAGNINISNNTEVEIMDFAESTAEARERQLEMERALEQKKLAKNIAVPTSEVEVRIKLREFGEPMCLFGEGPAERRDRLRDILVKILMRDGKLPAEFMTGGRQQTGADIGGEQQKELVYSEGTKALKDMRLFIAKYSIPRAAERVAGQKRKADAGEDENDMENEDLNKKMEILADTDINSSHVGDDRALTSISLNSTGDMAVTSSWTSNCKVWSLPDGKMSRKLVGHVERVQVSQFHPSNDESTPVAIATGSADATVKLWSLKESAAIATLEGHVERVNRVAFHPSGKLLASTSHDHTWRLWDLATNKEILQQTGHSRPVYGFAFHGDGSLAVSTGLEAASRVWDLRTGRNIVDLKGHVKGVLSADFSPDGFTVATGSEDHTVRIFDLRKKKLMYTIPAHSSSVPFVKFNREDGRILVSCGFDSKAKLWDTRDWGLVKTLAAHEGKVMGCDINNDGSRIVTCGSDRTWKIWSRLGL